MKIKSLAPWFGSKRRLAPLIVELIGDHRVYWEPFCGSMAVLLAKPVCSMETANDLHGDLINLARVVQDERLGETFYDKLCRTLCAERFFRDSKERRLSAGPADGEMDIDRAYDYFVASWMGLNGVSGTSRCNYQFALRWARGGGHGAVRWRNTVESIPAWHRRLRNVIITQRDAFEVLDNITDQDGTVIYCDPPYIEKSDKYVHDLGAGDHERLAVSLGRFTEAMVVVNYYDHPKLKDLYDGWERVATKQSQMSLRNATRGPKKKPSKQQVEVLLCNKRPDGNQLFK